MRSNSLKIRRSRSGSSSTSSPSPSAVLVLGQEARHLAALELHVDRRLELALLALALQLGEHAEVLDIDQVAVAEALEVAVLEEPFLAVRLEGADDRPHLEVELGLLGDAEDRRQRDGADREVRLLRILGREELEHRPHAVARHGEADHRIAVRPAVGEGEAAAGLVDRGMEGAAPGELADAVVGEAVPEALLPGLALRLHAGLVEDALLLGALEEGEPFEQAGAVEDALAAGRRLAGPFEEAHARRRGVEILGQLVAVRRGDADHRRRLARHPQHPHLGRGLRIALEEQPRQPAPDRRLERRLPARVPRTPSPPRRPPGRAP